MARGKLTADDSGGEDVGLVPGGEEDTLGLLLGPGTFGGCFGDLVLEGVLQGGRAEFGLTQEGELATMLEVLPLLKPSPVPLPGLPPLAEAGQSGTGNR
jgi:hypothetical protein